MDLETRNGTGNNDDQHHEYTNIYFLVGERRETATYRSDQVTDMELKELFRSAAEAGPLDIVKLRKGDKLLNISCHLPANTPDTPYVLQVVGAHPASLGMMELEVVRTLESRVASLERELREHQQAICASPPLALQELKSQVDSFKNKLETTEHLSWLGFYKQLPEPSTSEECKKLQYRRKSDSQKRKVQMKFFDICDVAMASDAREGLRSPAFDARQWEDAELLWMLQTMFVELELPQKFNIPLTILRNFLFEVFINYNEVPFHNFRHCFCVAQMMYAIAWAVDLPSRIGYLQVFILIVSCICHDLDHPGYNNIYQINARTELALRYNDISPLENHHCSVAFRVLESAECNILASLDCKNYRTVRDGIIRCILATDMARHNEILGRFTAIVQKFDYSNEVHIDLLSMILIKVADISNEARPMEVAEPWLDSLLQEFFKQSDAEKLEGLPVTPFMDRDKVTKPSSQCRFIGLVLLPLFEALGELFLELEDLIVRPVREALEYYRQLNEAAKDERHHRKSVADIGDSNQSLVQAGNTSNSTVVKSTSSHSMRSKRSTCTIHSRSRSTEDDITENLTIEEADNLESSDPETATEVEISEKTLKFKISTEEAPVSSGGRKSYPGSRKGSREKSSLDYHNYELVRAMREHERERKRSRGENILESNMSSPVSAKSIDDSKIFEELERDDSTFFDEKVINEIQVVEGNGNVIGDATESSARSNGSKHQSSSGINRKDISITRESVVSLCCSCDDKTNLSNNHKSLLSRLRNFTDRLSISFDSKDSPSPKATKHVAKSLNKSNSVSSSSTCTVSTRRQQQQHDLSNICKRCNLRKVSTSKEHGGKIATVVELSAIDKRAMTLPKVRKTQDCKNKGWKTVFAKERKSSASMEVLPREKENRPIESKHRRNLSNPEGNKNLKGQKSLDIDIDIEFKEIEVRQTSNNQQQQRKRPEIIVNPDNSSPCGLDDREDMGKIEIRRSSASMEDISKITKQTEGVLLGSLEAKKAEDLQHTGSLDSMLCKESAKSNKKVNAFSSPAASKKSSPGLFSRFKSGMSIDSTRSNSNSSSLHDQTSQQSQTGWISTLTASFRPKRQTATTTTTTTTITSTEFASSSPPTQSHKLHSREEIK
ncbi:PREDICTED: uncharacterized protein LOC107065017 [Polistes dominula]|uniref:Phosphodiesterase n=1 Tax=Polistes dominula TaxID=743375 RepID=A0ABM1I0N6_POLDO|nr:PREDICTED: uncharacterized protein LOC107065017 [Polistes dominula]XP_015173773.1 PREDICTED: uncharacterized protein LOC107065017 [Polistes dominula]